jgi:ABC-type glycerol-3-phosphate transport system substrate-binding protein
LQLTSIQGKTYALPFIGDALVIVYRPEKIGYPTNDWNQLMRIGQGLIFPAADPQAVFSLSLYQSTGGDIRGETGQPKLDADKLKQVLQFFLTGEKQGLFPSWLTQLEDDAQALQAYQDMKANILVTWVSNYLANLPADSVAMPLPPFSGQSITPAGGWVIAVTDPIADRRNASIKLAEYLVDSSFLSEWTAASGYLPTRPSELYAWHNNSVQILVDQVARSAMVLPTSDMVDSLGPVLQNVTIQVIKQQLSPEEAAKTASGSLGSAIEYK